MAPRAPGVAGWLLLALVALIGAAAGQPLGARIYDYQWRDARFCDDCHAHDYANEAWAASVHADLTTCHDCHRVPIRHYPRNLWVTVTDKPETPDDIHRPHVPLVVCGQCHSEQGAEEPLTGPMPKALQARVVKIDTTPLHRAHLDSKTRDPGAFRGGRGEATEPHEEKPADESPISCMDCHGGESNRAHRFESTTEACTGCHDAHAEELGMGGIACRQCHATGFLVPPEGAPAAGPTPGEETARDRAPD